MDMIGHYHPSRKIIAYSVEMLPGLYDCMGTVRILKKTTSVTGVEPFFNTFATFGHDILWGFLVQILHDLFQLGRRQAVCKTVGNHLVHISTIIMGNISARIPTAVSEIRFHRDTPLFLYGFYAALERGAPAIHNLLDATTLLSYDLVITI
jgi:hypothetical protein